MASSSPYRIHSVKALPKLPNVTEATRLLEQLVTATAALVSRRKWKVPLLTEFMPKQDGLLGMNVNRGSKIMIRLRDAHNSSAFLPWESLLGTLVHELVHIEIGAHSYDFYKLVDELCDEVQSDAVGRVSPAAKYVWADEQGRRLGGAGTSSGALRDLAGAAAAKRQRVEGHVLGGQRPQGVMMSRQQLMAAAAERRIADQTACGQGHALEEEVEQIDLTGGDYCTPCGVRGQVIDLT